MGVVTDDQHVDDQSPLRGHVKRERPAEEGNGVQVAREPGLPVSDEEPDHQQHRGDGQIFIPVLPVLLSQLHSSLPERWRTVFAGRIETCSNEKTHRIDVAAQRYAA